MGRSYFNRESARVRARCIYADGMADSFGTTHSALAVLELKAQRLGVTENRC